jgi:hypothetical protein
LAIELVAGDGLERRELVFVEGVGRRCVVLVVAVEGREVVEQVVLVQRGGSHAGSIVQLRGRGGSQAELWWGAGDRRWLVVEPI